MEFYFSNYFLGTDYLIFYIIMAIIAVLILAHFIIGYKDSKDKGEN